MGNWVYLNVTLPDDVSISEGRSDIDPTHAVPPEMQYVSDDKILGLVGDELKLYCIYGG